MTANPEHSTCPKWAAQEARRLALIECEEAVRKALTAFLTNRDAYVLNGPGGMAHAVLYAIAELKRRAS